MAALIGRPPLAVLIGRPALAAFIGQTTMATPVMVFHSAHHGVLRKFRCEAHARKDLIRNVGRPNGFCAMLPIHPCIYVETATRPADHTGLGTNVIVGPRLGPTPKNLQNYYYSAINKCVFRKLLGGYPRSTQETRHWAVQKSYSDVVFGCGAPFNKIRNAQCLAKK